MRQIAEGSLEGKARHSERPAKNLPNPRFTKKTKKSQALSQRLGIFHKGFNVKFEIRRAKNGWIIEHDDPEEFTTELVGIEEPDEHEGFRTLLWEFLRNYGPSDSKYSVKRIRVITIPGLDYEGPIEGAYRKDLEELRDELNEHLNRECTTDQD